MTVDYGAPPALLAMDLQHGVVDALPDPQAVLGPARLALDAARAAGVPVVFVRVAFRPDAPEVAASNRQFTALLARGGYGQDEARTQVHRALDPRPGEPVVLKKRVSAFTGSDLEVLLRGLGARHLVLAGVATSGVVLSTLRQAADLDFELTVLADACADRDAEVHRVLIEKVFPRQAAVTTAADWAASLG